MCGIVGYTGENIDKVTLNNMMDLISHRGPDGCGEFINDHVALGHLRLSIIDHSGGVQPMYNEDGKITIIFNGEIYNHVELRDQLVEAGHVFKTDHSDTEVLIHGYEQWGLNGLLSKLRGMFAFAIWDDNKKQLFCARDHFGIKPFYYYMTESGDLLFGSEIKSFLAHPEFKKEFNKEQLELYLSFQYSVGENTFFKGVKKLLPAHSLVFNNGSISIEKYWEPKIEADDSKSLDNWAQDIQDTMIESVAAHECSDAEVGSFLSSGIDSSYIAALSKVNKTFTAGFEDPKYDESHYAKDFSAAIDVENITKKISATEYWNEFANIQYHMDEPLADAASVAFYFVNREAAKHVKVCLSGEGADEFFAGYNTYKDPFVMTAYNKIPEFFRRIIGGIAALFPSVRGLNFLVRRSRNIENRYFGHTEIFTTKQIKGILTDYSGNKKPTDFTKYYMKNVKGEHDVTKMQYTDLHLWLAGDILLKADKMSMANSLELRVPFLDMKVFELARKVPVKHKVNANQTKIALRKAALQTIPKEQADKKKLGFPVPVRAWLREEQYVNIIEEKFRGDSAKEFFNTDKLLNLLNDHASNKADNWRQIWCVFSFLVWYEEFFIKR